MKAWLISILTMNLLPVCSRVSLASTDKPAPTIEKKFESTKERLVNRSILTVGREVFSAVDAVAVLAIWNLTRAANEKPVDMSRAWLNDLNVSELPTSEPELMQRAWPEDVRIFFQMALIWVDVQKLNLFVPKEQEIATTLATFKSSQDEILRNADKTLASAVVNASDKSKRMWIESTLRSRAFFRVRGAFERNRSLLNVGWYWHQQNSSGKDQ